MMDRASSSPPPGPLPGHLVQLKRFCVVSLLVVALLTVLSKISVLYSADYEVAKSIFRYLAILVFTFSTAYLLFKVHKDFNLRFLIVCSGCFLVISQLMNTLNDFGLFDFAPGLRLLGRAYPLIDDLLWMVAIILLVGALYFSALEALAARIRSANEADKLSEEVAERRRVEDQLKKSERMYREAIEVTGAIPYYQDYESMEYDFVGSGIESLTGYRPEEFTHDAWEGMRQEIVPPGKTESLSNAEALSRARRPEGMSWKADFRLRTRSGEEKWVANTAVQVRDESGKVLGFLGTLRDITARKQAEIAGQENEALLSAILDSTTDGILVVDENGIVAHFNKAFSKMWRLPEEDLQAGDERELLESILDQLEDPEAFLAKVQHLYRTSDVDRDSVIFKDGRDFERVSCPLTRNEEIAGRVWSFRDITKRKRAEEMLRESEARYSSLIREMLNGFALHEIICDDSGEPCDYRFLEVNTAFEEMVGIRRESIVGKTVREALPGTEQTWIDAYGKVAISGEPTHFEGYTGTVKKHFEVLAYSPSKGCFATVFTDITDRKRMEEELRESRDRYHEIFENSNAVKLIIDPADGRIVEANEAARQFYGYDSETFRRLRITEINILSEEQVQREMALATQERKQFFNFSHRLASGDIRDVEVYSGPVDSGGNVLLYSIIHDVTDRKRIEQALQESEERFRLSMEATRDGLWDWEITADLAYFSPGYYHMLGYEVGEFPAGSTSWKNLLHPDDREDAVRSSVDCIEGRFDTFEMEFRMKAKNGNWRWVLARGKCVERDSEGRGLRLVGTHVDITERKEVEADREKLLREMDERMKELRCMYRVTESIRKRKSLEDILQEVATLIPTGWQYPEIARGRTRLGENEFISEPFEETAWKQSSDIILGGRARGTIECFYLEELPEQDEGPFLTEERYLIDGMAQTLSEALERKEAEEALRESERFLQNILDAIQDGISVLDHDLNIIRANGWMRRMYPHETPLKGKKCYSVYQQREDPCPWCPTLEALKTGVTQRVEVPYPDANAPTGWMDLSAFPLKDEQGETTSVIEYVKDITERKRAEEALRQSEKRHRDLFETMAQGVVYQDADGSIVEANPAAERILGLTLDQMKGRTSTDSRWRSIHEDGSEFPGDTHPAAVALRTGKEVRDVVMGVFSPTKKGHNWINITAVPQFRSGENVPFQVHTTFQDITQRKQAEEERERYRDFMQTVIDGFPEALMVINRDYTVALANRTVREIAGNRDPVTACLKCYQVSHGSELPCEDKDHPCPLSCVLAEGKTIVTEHCHRDSQDREISVEIVAAPLFDENGEVVQIIESMRDITERKRTAGRIAASLREKEVLLREIHHRVKNNMQVIVSLLRMHSRRIDDERLRRVFDDCRDRVNAMSLIHEALYRSEDLAQIDFETYLTNLCRNLSHAYDASGSGIEVTIGQGDVSLQMDQGIAVGMVVSELVVNAFKHAFTEGEPGSVLVSLSSLPGGEVELVVQDNGNGIPPDIDIENLPSLGLRLVVATVTRELGGSIDVERAGGTRFVIRFDCERT